MAPLSKKLFRPFFSYSGAKINWLLMLAQSASGAGVSLSSETLAADWGKLFLLRKFSPGLIPAKSSY